MSAQRWCGPFVLLLLTVVGIHAARLPNVLRKAEIDFEAPSLPVIEVVKTIEQPHTKFTGIFHSEYTVENEGDAELSSEEEQLYLSWEIAWPKTGRRVDQFIRFRETQPSTENDGEVQSEDSAIPKGFLKKMMKTQRTSRGKRRVYGSDGRIYIPLRSLARRFPFASVVKLSTGCTGTLISPKHVLTAAHCIHNQSDYVTGYRNLAVGVLPASITSRKFRWISVNRTFLPNGWLMGNPDIASRFDYGLLVLEETHSKPYFELAISEGRTRERIHFTAFDDDKPSNTLWYRQCSVQDTDEHVLYHLCDAEHGSSGAGVYTWNYDKAQGNWRRTLIGVFSGNRWKYYKEWWKRARNYNAAIRFNTSKYSQLCGWMGKHAAKTCRQQKNSRLD